MGRLSYRCVSIFKSLPMDRTTTSPEFKPTLIWMGTPSVRLTTFSIPFHRILNPKRGIAGPNRMIFMRERRTSAMIPSPMT